MAAIQVARMTRHPLSDSRDDATRQQYRNQNPWEHHGPTVMMLPSPPPSSPSPPSLVHSFPLPSPFPGQSNHPTYSVTIDSRRQALDTATKTDVEESSPARKGPPASLIMWTDASTTLSTPDDPFSPSAAAISYRGPTSGGGGFPGWDWKDHAFAIMGGLHEPQTAELLAILEALRLAVREWDARKWDSDVGMNYGEEDCEGQDDYEGGEDYDGEENHDDHEQDYEEADGPGPFTTLRLFTDAQTVLLWLACPATAPPSRMGHHVNVQSILTSVLEATAQLSKRCVWIEFHWVPGHAGVDGNERADRVAKNARKHLMSRRERERHRRVEGGEEMGRLNVFELENGEWDVVKGPTDL